MVERRNHAFTGVPLGPAPTIAEALEMIALLDAINEEQRLRLEAIMDWYEIAVTDQVAAERRGDDLAQRLAESEQREQTSATELERVRADLVRCEAELAALHKTKLFRVARPARALYAKVRVWRG